MPASRRVAGRDGEESAGAEPAQRALAEPFHLQSGIARETLEGASIAGRIEGIRRQ